MWLCDRIAWICCKKCISLKVLWWCNNVSYTWTTFFPKAFDFLLSLQIHLPRELQCIKVYALFEHGGSAGQRENNLNSWPFWLGYKRICKYICKLCTAWFYEKFKSSLYIKVLYVCGFENLYSLPFMRDLDWLLLRQWHVDFPLLRLVTEGRLRWLCMVSLGSTSTHIMVQNQVQCLLTSLPSARLIQVIGTLYPKLHCREYMKGEGMELRWNMRDCSGKWCILIEAKVLCDVASCEHIVMHS